MPMMTYDEYEKTIHQPPYFFKIELGASVLYYFGERHSNDPSMEQWGILENLFNEFVASPNPKKIVLVEGGIPPVAESSASAITKFGGPGLITFLCAERSLQVVSPEPSVQYELLGLEKEFSRDEIQYYYFARDVLQWNRKLEPRPDFEMYLQSRLDARKRRDGWEDYDFSLGHMKRLHHDFCQKDFDPLDKDLFAMLSSPVRLKTKTNQVARRSSEIRDGYIVQQIVKYFNEGYSLFVNYGMTHAIMQEPYLKEMLEN